MERMIDLSKELEKRRAVVNNELKKLLGSVGEEATLRKAMEHYPAAGGKRLRPVLSMVVADAISGKGKKTIPFGLTLELIHNFTLVHDDIMDNDEVRHGIKTVHAAYGMPTAIIAGDALFALSFEMLSKTDIEDGKLRRLIEETAVAVRVIAEGQQMDMDFENRKVVTEKEYMAMIGKKTSSLFRLAASGGALIAGGTNAQVEAASNYGHYLGIGFQIRDDIIGITGNEKVLGKPIGSDIRNGKPTIIVVKALEVFEREDRERFMDIFGNEFAEEDDIETAERLLTKAGAIEYAQKIAGEYATKAKASLKAFKESGEKDILNALVDFVVLREA